MHWIKWPLILNDKDKGGLGVGSLDAFNLGLLYKWKWRFFNEPSVLWVQLIKSLYGDGGSFHEVRSSNGCGVWSKIVGSINRLHDQHVVAASTMSRVLGDGQFISFWNDVWCGTDSLKSLGVPLASASSGGLESAQYDALMDLLQPITLTSSPDRWRWSLDPYGCFSVKSVRSWIDASRLPEEDHPTRWNSCVPLKVNVHCWRAMLDRLPCRFNLAARGLPLESILCPICLTSQETLSHLLFICPTAVQVWQQVARWIQCQVPDFASMSDLVEWVDSLSVVGQKRSIVDSIFMVVIWVLWTYRNAVVFKRLDYRKQDIFDNIREFSFVWFYARNNKINMSRLLASRFVHLVRSSVLKTGSNRLVGPVEPGTGDESGLINAGSMLISEPE
ncbi:hypothetical protein LXL04_031825 [Taraxacum kok-saghyz]